MSSYRRRLLLANQSEENICFYGNSVQDGTPTPEAPVEIKSVENPIIKVDGEKIITINQNTPFGKNLLKPEKFTTVVKECITFNSAGDGSIIVNGTPNSTLSLNLKSEEELENLLIDGEKHTLALNPSLKNMSIALMIQRRNKSSNAISYISANRYNSYTVTEQIDKSKYRYQALYLQITITDPVQVYENMIVQPMLSLSEYAIPFEQYIHPITTMRGIGEYKDKIYTKDGKVYFEQMTAVFENDNLNDKFGTASSPRFYYYFEKPKNSLPSGITQTLQAKNPGLCNYFKYNPQLSENNTIFILSQNAIRAAFFTEDIEDVESWVANKTISVIYPIVKQEPIEITGYLAEQILAIDKTKNITITSENGVSGSAEVIVE